MRLRVIRILSTTPTYRWDLYRADRRSVFLSSLAVTVRSSLVSKNRFTPTPAIPRDGVFERHTHLERAAECYEKCFRKRIKFLISLVECLFWMFALYNLIRHKAREESFKTLSYLKLHMKNFWKYIEDNLIKILILREKMVIAFRITSIYFEPQKVPICSHFHF